MSAPVATENMSCIGVIQNDADIMEAMEGLEDVTEDQLTVKSIAKLSDSEMVLKHS